MPSKTQRILGLYDGVRTTKEIAEAVGCLPEYVRVVARQRMGQAESDIDRRYRYSPLGRASKRAYRKRRYHSDPEFRERVLKHRMNSYYRKRARLLAEARP